MLVNKHLGEVKATLDGKPFVLCLTLGALSELEASFESGDIKNLARRLEGGNLSANDISKVVGAGLRGAGHIVENADVLAMQIDGAANGWSKLVDELLTATFGGPNR